MRYRPLIKSAPNVSEIGLGAWQLGVNSGWKTVAEKEAIAMVRHAVDKGVNFIDTAPNYGNGTSEIRLGKALKEVDRDSIVINTKFGHTDTGTTNYEADYIRESVEGSLNRLQTDYVDSLIIHNPPPGYLDGNQNDHYEILELLKAEGKIKAYGASLDTYEEMKLLMDTTNSEVIEAFFNILHQDTARAFEMATKNGVGIIVKIPLDSSWLTGKYNETSKFDDIRSRWTQKDIRTRSLLVNKIGEIIPKGKSLAEVALSFCLSYRAVSTIIPGNTSLDQLDRNIASIEDPISEDLVSKLEKFYKDEVIQLNLPW